VVCSVEPSKPPLKAWLIEPQPGDLTWAERRVPTPYGPIKVKWKKTSQGLRLEIEVPNGTTGSVGLPTFSKITSTRSAIPMTSGRIFRCYSDSSFMTVIESILCETPEYRPIVVLPL
jgi:hypothetical protein